MTEVHTSICRTCFNFCGVRVETDGRRIVGISGDPDDPIYHGYRCSKGTEHRHHYDHPDRLLAPLKRKDDGSFVQLPLQEAIGEIAERLKVAIERHGPRSVAMYWGTFFFQESSLNVSFADAFMSALGSPMQFNSATIDQPGKQIAKGLHGMWLGGDQSVHEPKVALFVGTNPIVSHQGRIGSPAEMLRDFDRWDTTTIVIDPRRTELVQRLGFSW